MTYHHGHLTTQRTTGMGFPQGGVCSASFWSLAFDEAVRLINAEDTLGVPFADDCAILSGGADPALLVSRVQCAVTASWTGDLDAVLPSILPRHKSCSSPELVLSPSGLSPCPVTLSPTVLPHGTSASPLIDASGGTITSTRRQAKPNDFLTLSFWLRGAIGVPDPTLQSGYTRP